MQELIERLVRHGTELWSAARKIWLDGGWAMIAIAVIAFVMFSVGMRLFLALRRKGFKHVPERTWRRWIDAPDERRGRIGTLLDFVTGGLSEEDMTFFFRQLRVSETLPFERDLRVMKICVSAAPLVGLLGTVTGMLTTFGALATGSGGDQTMGMIAGGISEALITTETGLVIALPGLFFQYHLSRGLQQYKAFLAHLESVCLQRHHRTIRERLTREAEAAARLRIAERLRERVGAAHAGTHAFATSEAGGPDADADDGDDVDDTPETTLSPMPGDGRTNGPRERDGRAVESEHQE
ncbi:MAG: MotA/TolQ/ExbB proton channel family protein [Planctomycetota bacterium]